VTGTASHARDRERDIAMIQESLGDTNTEITRSLDGGSAD
jgi:hypothetical protein